MVPIAALLLAVASVSCARNFVLSKCNAPLGMETGLIPDVDITASSCYHDGNVAPHNGRLNSERAGGAWCPRSQIFPGANEWLEVDFRVVHVVTAVATQGRFGNGQGQEFVEEYELEYWRPRIDKWVSYKDVLGQKVLSGNTNTYLVAKNYLAAPVWATKVRFIPNSHHRRTVCMRVELYGCQWDVGIVQYSMPEGDMRGNSMDFTDITYDGFKSGGQLRGGLGQLVDGEFGKDEIREPSRLTTWVGWRNDTRRGEGPRAPPTVTFEFERVREFVAVHVHCNNKFMRDVRAFSTAVVRFSIGGVHYQEDAVHLKLPPDNIFESSRNVTISLHHRIARWVQLELHFAARWILISEVSFESVPAQGNHTLERARMPPTGVEGAARAPPALSPPSAPVHTARPQDPIYVAVIVGIMTALAILLGVAVFLLVHRHQHRKCFSSTLGKSTVRRALDDYGSCDGGRLNGDVTASPRPSDRVEVSAGVDDYQEPYHTIPSAPCTSINARTELLEMTRLHGSSLLAFDTDSNYDYAVPEACSAPLMTEPRGRLESLSTHCSTDYQSQFSFGKEGGVIGSVRCRTGDVPELPAHRLRMISKIAEGSFGTVYVAEADGLPEYNSDTRVDKRLVAVKFLVHGATKAEFEVFERDVHVLAALAHPCLARVIGICRRPSAIVLEYLERGDLRAFLGSVKPPPPLRSLLHIIDQLATGMAYLEGLNFFHRDLAARNCLVGAGYRIKISDFGTDNEIYARDYVSIEGRVLPLRWSAPEVAFDNQYTTQSDVWAFGITLHEVFSLCRRRPYARLTDDIVLLNLRYLANEDSRWKPIERAPICPRDLYDMMIRCWSREPQQRPSFRGIHSFLLSRHSDSATS